MIPSERLVASGRQLTELRKLVSRGEGQVLEFKRKAAHPDKIAKELIAFANTDGGTLLIGVEDTGGIPGVKFPEEELLAVRQALEKYCRPAITITEDVIPIAVNRYVVRLDVEINNKRPHHFKSDGSPSESFVRSGESSVRASKEMLEIVRRSRKGKDIRFTFGEPEKLLMEHLDEKKLITLDEFRSLARLNRFTASRKLILLVLANVLRIHPSEKGDRYSRVG